MPMISSLKRKIKRLLGRPVTDIHSDWNLVKVVGANPNAHVVFDLGARNGWFTQCWLGWCPQAQIHAFEAEPNAAEILTKRYANEPRVTVVGQGVGSERATKTFYRMRGSEVSSSFLEHEASAWDAIKYETGEVEQQQVELITLDDYCRENQLEDIYLIKIDIQGFELEALRGAKNILPKVDYIMVESAIIPLYQGSATFSQVHDYLVASGFHLINWRSWHRGNHVMIETDMLFRRNGLEQEVLEGQDHVREYIGG
jgi:FkbM family methyltransferase